MENLPDHELMDIDTEQQTINNERERERVRSRERRIQVSNSAQRDARLATERLRIREMRARENSAERNTRLEADREYTREMRNHESDAERNTRLVADRERLDHETPEQTSHRLNNNRLRNNARNANRRSGSAGTGFASRYDYNLSPPQPFTIHLRDKICPHCSAQLFKSELKLKSACCGKGDTRSPESCQLDQFPSPLFELFASQHPGSSNFWEYIRRFNSAFSFASFGAESSTPPGRGPYCYRIHGQTYHRTGILHNETGTTPSFAQIYILEGNGVDCKVTDDWLYCYLSSLFDMSQMFNLIEIEFDKGEL